MSNSETIDSTLHSLAQSTDLESTCPQPASTSNLSPVLRILITGICGFVGSVLARELPRHFEGLEVLGIDNLCRPGSERNRAAFRSGNVRFVHGDIRNTSDLEGLTHVDWVIDTAANPSVLAGISNQTSSRQVIEHNLLGTLNLLEFCKQHQSGFLLLSTSRVYSQKRLSELPLSTQNNSYLPRFGEITEPGISKQGVQESFSTQSPLSLYGCAKLASELLALEYGAGFGLPVHINRCGVLAGAGQFGKPDQGIFSYWIHSYRAKRPLQYIGFGGTGYQVRDCLHPQDLAPLIATQIKHPQKGGNICNVGGGVANSMSLVQLSDWCARRFGSHAIKATSVDRPYDVPWLVLDASQAQKQWDWRPSISLEKILSEIAEHAERNPDWLQWSEGA